MKKRRRGIRLVLLVRNTSLLCLKKDIRQQQAITGFASPFVVSNKQILGLKSERQNINYFHLVFSLRTTDGESTVNEKEKGKNWSP